MSDPNGWQDIATAPKDGTEVDLWVEAGQWSRRIVDCKWRSDPDYSYERYGHAGTVWTVKEPKHGWYGEIMPHGDPGWLNDQPTHWRPVPSPPDPDYWERRQALKERKIDIE